MKDKFAKSLLDRDENISNIRNQIETFEIMSNTIQSCKSSDKIGCIHLDNTIIKQTIVDILLLW